MLADFKERMVLARDFLVYTALALKAGEFPEKYVNLQNQEHRFYLDLATKYNRASCHAMSAIEDLLRAEGKLPEKQQQ
eukprot:m51a1_g1494 hypothetical protein (78) ;mRNA; f:325070-325303